MDLMSADPAADYPALSALVTAFHLAHVVDDAAARAAEKAIRMLRGAVVLAFDGVELRVQSESEPETWYVTDGETCTCKARGRAWCKHRVIFRQLLALAALRQPGQLRAAVVEQLVPQRPALPAAQPEPAPWDADPDYLTFTYQPYASRPARPAAAQPPLETPRQRAYREVAELYA